MPSDEHLLERSIVICAVRSTVFRFFTDPERFERWWGKGSTIDPEPGGKVQIVYPNGIRVSGEVRRLEQDRSISFSYGYESGNPIPPGSSEVTITLEDHIDGTFVRLTHVFTDDKVRDAHDPGWRYQMAVFATIAAEDQHAALAETVDDLFLAWREVDPSRRKTLLEQCVTENVRFSDQHGCVQSIEELTEHIGAVQMHLPGAGLERSGAVRQCQGMALADWSATNADAKAIGRGTNVYELHPDGRIRRITGMWSTAETS